MDASATPTELHNARRIVTGAEGATDPNEHAAWAVGELADTLALARAVVRGLAVPTEAGTRALTAGRLHAAHLNRYGVTCPTADDHECRCEVESYPVYESAGYLRSGRAVWVTVAPWHGVPRPPGL